MAKGTDFYTVKEKDKLLFQLLNQIIIGRFDFKKGNTLASLAEAISANNATIFVKMDQMQFLPFDSESWIFPTNEVKQLGTVLHIQDLYLKLVLSLMKIIPFYQIYFPKYNASKKLVVLNLFKELRLYD